MLAQRRSLCSELDAERLATLATSSPSKSAVVEREKLITKLIRAGFTRDPMFNLPLPDPSKPTFNTAMETMDALVARSNTIDDPEMETIFGDICREFQARLHAMGPPLAISAVGNTF